MKELRDQDLILYYYGEARRAEAIRRRLDASPADAERYKELCRVLELVDRQPVPEPWDDYDARAWRRLQPRLGERSGKGRVGGRIGWFTPRRLDWAVSVAALMIVAFLAGRFWPVDRVDPGIGSGPRQMSDLTSAGRERILLISVGEHLERSEMLLVELVNAPPGGADLAEELRRAEELLPFNRLYRQAARRSGQAAVAEVLDELERLLLDVAHSGDLSAADLGDLRRRIESGGILFRVQVIGSRVERLHRPSKQPPLPEASGDV